MRGQSRCTLTAIFPAQLRLEPGQKASSQHEQRAPAGATTAGEIEGPKFRAREHVPSLPCNVNYSHERELELYKELKS